jgi:hypothetical protein
MMFRSLCNMASFLSVAVDFDESFVADPEVVGDLVQDDAVNLLP